MLMGHCKFNYINTLIADKEEVDNWAAKFHSQDGIFPINYLCFLRDGNHHKRVFWEPLIDKLRAKLDV